MAPSQKDNDGKRFGSLRRLFGSFKIGRRHGSNERQSRRSVPTSPATPPASGTAPWQSTPPRQITPPGRPRAPTPSRRRPVYTPYRPPRRPGQITPPPRPRAPSPSARRPSGTTPAFVPLGAVPAFVPYRPPGGPPALSVPVGGPPAYVPPAYTHVPQPPPVHRANPPQWDVLSRKFGPAGLNGFGIIDMNPLPPVQHDARGKGGTLGANLTDPIHPVLRRKQWRNLSDADWDLILPSIHFASRILYDPAIASFFKGLANPMRATDALSSQAEVAFKQPIHRFYLSPCADLNEAATTFRMIADLANHTTLQFGGASTHSYGTTFAQIKALPPTELTCPSRIKLEMNYLEVLRGETKSTAFQFCANFDPAAARLRTYLHLGSCIVHEITHAFNYRYYQHGGTVRNRHLVEEPYMRDEKVAEVGHAYENAIYGGRLGIIGYHRPHVAAPYGLCTSTWPGMDDHESHIGRPDLNDYIQAVLMSEVHKFFTQRFWEHDVDRFSVEPFKFKKHPAASAWVTGNTWYS